MLTTMQLLLNGEPHTLPDGTTVRELIERLGLHTQPTAVEVNKSLVPRRKHEAHVLKADDRVEVVTLVGGG
jgi:sulfur carrier protein